MFVRFRQQSSNRLSVSIVESRRVAGKLKHEHIAALGSIETPPTIVARIAFWKRLHERLGKLSNRVDPATAGRLMGAVHERVPMPTADGQRALQRENFEADEEFWDTLHDMHAGAVEEQKAVIAEAERKIAEAQIEMARAAERRDDARARVARLDRGEDVPGGNKRLTPAEIIKLFGWTPSDVRHAQGMNTLSEIEWEAWFKEKFERTQLAGRRISKATLRAFLHRRTASS